MKQSESKLLCQYSSTFFPSHLSRHGYDSQSNSVLVIVQLDTIILCNKGSKVLSILIEEFDQIIL